MANNKPFKIKNGLIAGRYLQSAGTKTAGSEGYNLAGASYDGVSFSVGSQDVAPTALSFKSDGTKMYIAGNNLVVYQYSLSTAWDLSTASYDSVSFSVISQVSATGGLAFNNDGTKMYVGNAQTLTNGEIYQYSLSTAWDVSTASYDSVSLDTDAVDFNPLALFWKSDGSALYFAGAQNDSLFQYTVSTAYDLSTASYTSKSLDVSSQVTTPSGLSFNSDGTALFVDDATSDAIYQYNLSTAWDISTGSYSDVSFSVSSQDTNPRNMFFKPDGTKMYVVGITNDTIYQYSTVLYTQTLDLSTGTYFSFTPSVNTEMLFTNPPASGEVLGFTVEINGDGSAITWPDSIKWHEATIPTATASKEIYTFITTDGGTTYYGRKAAENLQ